MLAYEVGKKHASNSMSRLYRMFSERRGGQNSGTEWECLLVDAWLAKRTYINASRNVVDDL